MTAGTGERIEVVLSGPIKGICKSHALWAKDGVTITPIVFLHKPKWVTNNDAWVKFIRGMFMSISAEGQAALNEMLESAVLDREEAILALGDRYANPR